MILGGEQPVALPTMDWYDKDMMKLYLAAVKDDYDKAVKREDDFFEKYGDFIAATSKDLQFMHDKVINPIVQFINNNPDAIRSAEGRAAMAALMRSIPHEQIGNIKATAKMADTYNKAMALMIADGTYSEDMQKVMGVNLKDWDSASQGAFQQAAPYKLDSIQKLLDPTITQLGKAYRYNDALTKEKHDGRRYSTVSDQQIYDSLNGDYVDLMQRPGMQYYLKKYIQENPNATEDDFKNMLFRQVRGLLGEKTEKDDLYFANLSFKQQVALEGIKHRHAKELAEAKNGGSGNYPHLSTRLTYESDKKFNQTSQPMLNAMYFENYFRRLASTENNQNNKNKYLQYASEWKNFGNLSEENQIKFLKKYKYVDSNGQLTKKYSQYLANAVKTGGEGIGVMQGKKGNLITLSNENQTIRNATAAYKRDATGITDYTADGICGVIFGEKDKKTGYRTFKFGARGMTTDAAAMTSAGIKPSHKNVRALANYWLRKTGTTGNIYGLSDAYQKSGNNKIEVSGIDVTVPLTNLKGMITYLRSKGVTGEDSDILRKAGITVVDSTGEAKHNVSSRTDAKGRTSYSTSESYTGRLFGKIKATAVGEGEAIITDINTADFNKRNTRSKSYDEFPNQVDASADVQ